MVIFLIILLFITPLSKTVVPIYREEIYILMI